METAACPTTDELVQLFTGEITGSVATRLTLHLESCARCIESLQALEETGAVEQNNVADTVASLPMQPYRVLQSANETDENALDFLAPAISSDEIGRLAHYRVFKVLGEGGMGMVLQAEDTQLERAVALKVIKQEYRHDERIQQRFMREARAMAQVKSDHVVTIHQVGKHEGLCYIAMELLEGSPLNDLLDAKTRPSLRECLRIGREIAQALDAAHAHGLIHRDIKPENVWLEAPNGRVKLLDFGLARPQQDNTKLTATGMIMGTPAYMSPEQARASEVDGRSDLFSIGCLLYALIGGESPFSRKTIMDSLVALATDSPSPPSSFNSECPQELDDLVMHLLAKDPKDRVASAQAVITRLSAIEKNLSASSSAAGDPLSPSVWLRAVQGSPVQSAGSASSLHATGAQRSHFRKSERRQVTVLVCGCELFESENFLENLDAEKQDKVIRTFEDSCRQAVLQTSGTIVQCNKEGLIACYGYPIAHEDAPKLACSAALTISDALADLSEQFCDTDNLQLSPWLAIHTGPAVVAAEGPVISLAGEARSVALRLKDVTADGEVVLSEFTHKMLRGKFNCLSIGHHKIKGLEQPIELFQLQEPNDVSNQLANSGSIELTPLTGRDLEMSVLKERWQQAQEGMGQVVLLIGEAGLGKSRLVHALKEYVSTNSAQAGPSSHCEQTIEDSPIIEWHCSPHFRNTGLYPACDFFQRILNFRRDETSSAQIDRLVKHLEQLGLPSKDMAPLFASLLSLSTEGQFSSLGLTPSRERDEMFQALKDWMQAYCARQPVVFVIEDLQWLDASTLEFLGEMLSEGLPERMLVLLTFRPEFRPPWHALSNQTNLSLNRLTKRQVSELMRTKAGDDLPEAVIDDVYDRSGGVPLFTEEFTKMVIESGILTQAGNSGKQFKSLMAHAIPATLQDLMMSRLDRIEGDRELAQCASALGREFSHELIAAVASVDSQIIEVELTKLVQAEILCQKGRSPQSTYVFKHALFEDALYNSMVKSHRQQCHGRIAEALELQFPKTVETQPELLAHHFAEAGLHERSMPYWLAAGLRSQQQFANVEAISHFTRGLNLLGTLPESPERDRNELSLLSPLGSSYQTAFGYAAPDVGPTFARARELCQKIGDSEQLFEIMWGNWTWHLVRGDLDLCMRLSEEMLSLSTAAQDNGMRMEAHVAPAVTLFYRGDFAGCRNHCEKAIAEYEDLERCILWSAKLGQNSSVVVRCYLSLALWHLGCPEQALELSKEVLILARKIAHPFSMAHALHFASWLYHCCRLEDELNIAAQEEVAIAADQGFALWEATGTFHIGAALLLKGNLPEALQHLESGVQSFRAIDASLTLPAQLAVLAEGYLKTERLADAQQALADGLALAEKQSDRSYLPELCRLSGELALATSNNQSLAEKFFREGIERARLQKSRAWELRSTLSLARLLQEQGQADLARDSLSTIYSDYSEGRALPDLREAKALIERSLELR